MMLRNLRCPLIGAVMVLIAQTCFADAVLYWNDVALARVSAAAQSPPDGARAMAIVHLAIFEAVNAVDRRYTPYAFEDRASADSSAEAASAAAARAVLAKLYPEQVAQVEAAYRDALASVPESDAKAAGISLGERVAARCLALRANDGTGAPNAYRPRTAPGEYVPTALPIGAEWAKVKPWFIGDGARFRPAPPPALSTALWARDYDEMKNTGGSRSAKRTPAQTEAARFWTITGAASWNPVVRALAMSRSASLVDNARLFALVNMAASDAFVAVFDAKYAYTFWRPITAIRLGDTDGNDATAADSVWTPLVETPMHPEYPCAHCITASAVAAVLESEFGAGEVAPIEMTSPTAPGAVHRWTRIADYAAEVSNARVWGGLHYRNSTQVGETMGKAIGELAVREILEPVGANIHPNSLGGRANSPAVRTPAAAPR